MGREAVTLALAGKNSMMPAIRRISQTPYQWDVISAPLSQIANQEKFMPRDFISENGFGITQACRDYLSPLIQGEDFPPFENGLPKVAKLKLAKVEQKLPKFTL